MMVGAHSDAKPIDDEVKNAVAPVMDEMKSKLGGDVELTAYTRQTVAGVNYKLQGTSAGKAFSALVFVDLPHNGGKATLKECAFN